MPPPSSQLEYVRINDFSPGIRANPIIGHSSRIIAPPGVAHPTNTYRCQPLPFGGLGPMPKRAGALAIAVGAGTYRGSVVHISGLHAAGPIVQSTSPAAWSSGEYRSFPTPASAAVHEPIYVYFVLDYEFDVAGQWRRNVFLHRMDLAAATVVNLFGYTSVINAPVDEYPGVDVVSARSVGDTTAVGARIFTDIGSPVIVAGFKSFNPDHFALNRVTMFPNPSTVTTVIADSNIDLALLGGRIISHQARIVSAVRQIWAYGDLDALQDTNIFQYSKPNEIALGATANYFEGPMTVGAWASMTSADLIIIGTREGAVLIQGDLAAPIVRKLPAVTPTHGIEVTGVVTPLGFIYGSNKNGVHAWSGGSESTLLSPHLPGDFFHAANMEKSTAYKGRFAFWHDWIMVPANWCFHLPTQSWWRIDPTSEAEIAHWFTSPFGTRLYGALGTYSTLSTPATAGYFYDPTILASDYRWESQVIRLDSTNRRCKAREITLLADGVGTVIVTLTDLTGATIAKTFNLANTGPQLIINTEIALEMYGLIIRIDANSGVSTTPAPIVHEVLVGYTPMQRATG